MYAMRGDRVLVSLLPLDSSLECFRGKFGLVIETAPANYPMSVVVKLDSGEEVCFYNSDLNVIPPKYSIFQYNDEVKIVRNFDSTPQHICKNRLIGQKGTIIAYDKRDGCYKVVTHDDEGWFPPGAIIPINFIGDHFYLPGETVEYKEQSIRIAAIKKTKLGWGQLLYLTNEWVPSSEVQRSFSKNG